GASTITVTARDQYGNVIKNKAVTLAVTGNNNTLTPPSGPTGTNGVATGTLSSTLAQTKTISATVGTVMIAQQATVTVTAAAADTLARLVQPSNVAAGVHITPALQVEVRDQFGNRVTAATAGITLAIGTNPSGGALTVTSRNAVNGVATFDDASIDKAGSGYTLVASSGGLGPVTSSPFNVSAAAATSIAPSAGSSQTGTAGTPVQTPPAVIVRDQFANPVAGVAVTFATSGDNGTVDPATPVATGANGIAAANSWTLGTTAKVDTLRATAAGLSGSPVTFTATATAGGPTTTRTATVNGTITVAQTATVSVSPAGASASQSLVAASPGTITASSGSSASTITVTVKDANGNPVSGATVTLAASPVTGITLTQPAGTTNTSGQITGALSSTAAGTKTVTATVNGSVTVTQTATVTVSAAAAASIAPHAGNGQTVPAGTAVLVPPSVIVAGAFGHPASGGSATVA